MEKLFRYIVVISTVLFVFLHILPFIDHMWLTEKELDLAAYDAWGANLPTNIYFYWGNLSVWVTIFIGLFFYIPVSRTAFVIMLVLTSIASFFYGFSVLPAISATVGNIVTMTDGALLVMLYLTSVSR
ncbi:MAG: hypothetical protein OQK78_07250, partial [Gammaproteobacteria bacterium]|nr:hypothetical protein [Gammaproteobacteria bacterium]